MPLSYTISRMIAQTNPIILSKMMRDHALNFVQNKLSNLKEPSPCLLIENGPSGISAERISYPVSSVSNKNDDKPAISIPLYNKALITVKPPLPETESVSHISEKVCQKENDEYEADVENDSNDSIYFTDNQEKNETNSVISDLTDENYNPDFQEDDYDAESDNTVLSTDSGFSGQEEHIKSLIKKYNPLNRYNLLNEDGFTLLHLACIKGDLTAVENALKEGACPDIRTSSGSTALHLAAYKGSSKIIEALLKAGADRTMKDCDEEIPLQIAERKNRNECIKHLS